MVRDQDECLESSVPVEVKLLGSRCRKFSTCACSLHFTYIFKLVYGSPSCCISPVMVGLAAAFGNVLCSNGLRSASRPDGLLTCCTSALLVGSARPFGNVLCSNGFSSLGRPDRLATCCAADFLHTSHSIWWFSDTGAWVGNSLSIITHSIW